VAGILANAEDVDGSAGDTDQGFNSLEDDAEQAKDDADDATVGAFERVATLKVTGTALARRQGSGRRARSRLCRVEACF